MMSPEERQEIVDFLHLEAELLDTGRLEEWLDLLTEDVSYRMPVRLTRERGEAGDHSTEMQYFWDDHATLTLRVRDRKSTRLNSSHIQKSRMPSSA